MSENKRYYWLKLKTDFFASKEMKKLRSIAGGDTYTIIYLKLQLLSLQDEGKLYFDNVGDSFADELSLVIDEDPDNIKVTLQFLEKCGLIQAISEHEFLMTRVPALIGSETNKAAYMRKIRGNNVTQLLPNCYPRVPQEIDKEIEKDKYIYNTDFSAEKSGEKEKKSPNPMPKFQEFVDLYHQLCPSLPKVQKLTEGRKSAIKARWLEYPDIEIFKSVFTKCENNQFMKGKNDRNWVANFDFIFQASSFTKIVEGFYDKMGGATPTTQTTQAIQKKPLLEGSSFETKDFYTAALKRSTGGK